MVDLELYNKNMYCLIQYNVNVSLWSNQVHILRNTKYCNFSKIFISGKYICDTVKISDSATTPPPIRPPKISISKKAYETREPHKLPCKLSIDKPPRIYAPWKKLTKQDRPSSASRIFTGFYMTKTNNHSLYNILTKTEIIMGEVLCTINFI